MKILHIGATGFLGSKIIKKLLRKNYKITIISRNPKKKLSFDKSKLKIIKADILDFNKNNISGNYDIIVYTAMSAFKPGRITQKKFNKLKYLTTKYFSNTINLAKKLNTPLLITSGASFETKNNQIADERSKITRKGMARLGEPYDNLIEKLKNEKSIPVIEMLPAQIYGNGGKFKNIIHSAKNGKVVILGNGKNHIPKIHIDDCANAFIAAIEKTPFNKRFIIADDKSVSVKNFMNYIAKIFNVNKKFQIPNFILRLVVGKYIYNTLTMNSIVSNKFAKKELDWKLNYPDYKKGLYSLKSSIIK